MIRRRLEAWNKFIRDRILQEQGGKEDPLSEFEQAINPSDRCFRDASKVAYDSSDRNLSSVEEHLLVCVQQGYQRLGEIAASEQNEPLEALKRILTELEGCTPFDGYVKTYNGGLHW